MGRCPICLRYANKKFFACPTCRTRYHVACMPNSCDKCYYCTKSFPYLPGKYHESSSENCPVTIAFPIVIVVLWFIILPSVSYRTLRNYGAFDCREDESKTCLVHTLYRTAEKCRTNASTCSLAFLSSQFSCNTAMLFNHAKASSSECAIFAITIPEAAIFEIACMRSSFMISFCIPHLLKCMYYGTCADNVY